MHVRPWMTASESKSIGRGHDDHRSWVSSRTAPGEARGCFSTLASQASSGCFVFVMVIDPLGTRAQAQAAGEPARPDIERRPKANWSSAPETSSLSFRPSLPMPADCFHSEGVLRPWGCHHAMASTASARWQNHPLPERLLHWPAYAAPAHRRAGQGGCEPPQPLQFKYRC
jgi:hypothetical protein